MNTDSRIETIKNWLGTGSINIFGLPFAGKNTQADTLVTLFGATLIASGDIFRSQQDNTELQAIMATGANVPSHMFFDIVLPYFENPQWATTPLILSEVGRKDGEQENILRATEESGHPTKAVVLLSLSEEDVWRRFETVQSRGDAARGHRQDDSDRTIVATRLEKFRREIMPVIDFYRSKGLLIEVDGSKSRHEVTELILDALADRAK